MAIFSIDKNTAKKLSIKRFKNEKELQGIFEQNSETIFGVRFLATEFITTHGGRIDTLGIDEDNAPVIIEYKENAKDNIINQGLFYLDWLVDHKGDFEVLAINKLGGKVRVNWDVPRLILVAQNFNEWDKYAVNRIADNIELWKYTFYENNALLVERINLPKAEKQKQKRIEKRLTYKEHTTDDHLKGKSATIRNLFANLQENILGLDSRIKERAQQQYIAYALERNFCELVIQANAIKVYLDIQKEALNDPRNIAEDCTKVGHWATGTSRLELRQENETPYLLSLIKQSYEAKL